MAWTSLCELGDLNEGAGKYVEVGGLRLAVFLHRGKVHTMDNYCPHAGGNMAGGYVEEGCAICPWHHWAFRLDTGHLRDTTAVQIPIYPTRLLERDGHRTLVQADLP